MKCIHTANTEWNPPQIACPAATRPEDWMSAHALITPKPNHQTLTDHLQRKQGGGRKMKQKMKQKIRYVERQQWCKNRTVSPETGIIFSGTWKTLKKPCKNLENSILENYSKKLQNLGKVGQVQVKILILLSIENCPSTKNSKMGFLNFLIFNLDRPRFDARMAHRSPLGNRHLKNSWNFQYAKKKLKKAP